MPADLTLPSVSTQFVQVPVQAQSGGVPVNPTGDAVQFAFVAGSGYPATFYTGSWQTTIQGSFIAQVLIGPAGVVSLPPATYTVWVRIQDNPEVPVLPAGSLQIT